MEPCSDGAAVAAARMATDCRVEALEGIAVEEEDSTSVAAVASEREAAHRLCAHVDRGRTETRRMLESSTVEYDRSEGREGVPCQLLPLCRGCLWLLIVSTFAKDARDLSKLTC